jgi:hypothetical protein
MMGKNGSLIALEGRMFLSNQSEPLPNPGLAERRSPRIPLVIPITVSGVHPATGIPFKAFGKTLVVNQHGALINTISGLRSGVQLCITVESSGKSVGARVVWDAPQDEGRYGIELEAPGNPWGVFPGD